MPIEEQGYDRFKQSVAEKIKQLRLKAGLVQEDMFEEGWLSTRSYQDLEKGLFFPKGRSLYVICKKLNVEPKVLFEDISIHRQP